MSKLKKHTFLFKFSFVIFTLHFIIDSLNPNFFTALFFRLSIIYQLLYIFIFRIEDNVSFIKCIFDYFSYFLFSCFLSFGFYILYSMKFGYEDAGFWSLNGGPYKTYYDLEALKYMDLPIFIFQSLLGVCIVIIFLRLIVNSGDK